MIRRRRRRRKNEKEEVLVELDQDYLVVYFYYAGRFRCLHFRRDGVSAFGAEPCRAVPPREGRLCADAAAVYRRCVCDADAQFPETEAAGGDSLKNDGAVCGVPLLCHFSR